MLPAHNGILNSVEFINNLRLILNLGHVCFLILRCARYYKLADLFWFENGQVYYSEVCRFLPVIIPEALKAFNRIFGDLHAVFLIRFD